MATGSMEKGLARRFPAARWDLRTEVCSPELVQSVKGRLPEGWGLLSVGTGKPTVIVEAPWHDVAPPSLDIMRGLLHARPPKPRHPKSVASARPRLAEAIADAVGELAAEDLEPIERALAARRGGPEPLPDRAKPLRPSLFSGRSRTERSAGDDTGARSPARRRVA